MDGAPELFGKTALERGLVTREQLDEALREQGRLAREGLPPRPLGELLVSRGHLSAEALAPLLEEQRRRLADRETGGGETLGRLAVTKGLCTDSAVNDALRLQQEMTEQGLRLSLGEVLIRKGSLTADQLRDLLALQQKTPFYCSTCHIVYNVVGYVPGKKCRCPECRHRLSLIDDPGRMVGSSATLASPPPARSTPEAVAPAVAAAAPAAASSDGPPSTPSAGVAEPESAVLAAAPAPEGGASEPAGAATGGPPPSLGRYELLQEIGRGSMGVVYKAWDTEARAILAVKVLHEAYAADPQVRMFFRHQAEAHSRLAHRHILEPRDVGEFDGWAYFTMDFVEGRSFEDLLAAEEAVATAVEESEARREATASASASAPSTVEPSAAPATAAPDLMDSRLASRLGTHQALQILRDAATALGYAHARGIAHRGVRPENLLVDANLHAYVTDFGLDPNGRVSLPEADPDAVPPSPAPRPTWAPEQVEERRDAAGPATDVWALGVILYRILAGRPPFRGETPDELAASILRDQPPPFRTVSRFVQSDLKAVCLKCLEKDPSDRYRDAEEVADELTRFFEGRRTAARPLTTIQRLRRRARRNRPAVTALAGALVLLTGVLAYGTVEAVRAQINVHHHLGAGRLREEGGDLKAARAAYQKALDLDPKNGQAQAALSRVSVALVHKAEARRHAQGEGEGETAGLAPIYTSPFWAEVGQARLDLARAAKTASQPWAEDARRAEEALDRALLLDGRSAPAFVSRARLHELHGAYDQALGDFEAADAIYQGGNAEVRADVDRLRAMFGGGFQK
ncbi:MAG: protein kinase [Planctomycetes bacterium]|nr:protein kinase [Planctomycetota bacterium]